MGPPFYTKRRPVGLRPSSAVEGGQTYALDISKRYLCNSCRGVAAPPWYPNCVAALCGCGGHLLVNLTRLVRDARPRPSSVPLGSRWQRQFCNTERCPMFTWRKSVPYVLT